MIVEQYCLFFILISLHSCTFFLLHQLSALVVAGCNSVKIKKKNNQLNQIRMTTSQQEQEIRNCITEYTNEGKRPFHEEIYEERRKLQNPSVFAVPSLKRQEWWNLPEIQAQLLEARESIKQEFVGNVGKLERQSIEKDVLNGTWNAWYLMEEGLWKDAEYFANQFPCTTSLLKQLPIMENG